MTIRMSSYPFRSRCRAEGVTVGLEHLGGALRFRGIHMALSGSIFAILAGCGTAEPAAPVTVTMSPIVVPTTVRTTAVITTTATVTVTETTSIQVTSESPSAPATTAPTAIVAPRDRDQVTYSITASESGSALITYSEDANFNISQENGAELPWTKELTIPAGSFRILSLSAQNSGGGDISCSISVGGQVVDTATSSGDYAIVTCSHNG